jgi:NTE family protein
VTADSAPPGVALVIGSGSVKCAAAIGLHRVLVREGIAPDMVVGCSAGALFGALIAAGFAPEEQESLARRLWTRELTGRRDTRSLLRALLPGVLGFDEKFGLKDDRAIHAVLLEVFGDRKIEDLPHRLFVAGTDFATGEQVVFSRGSLVDALRGSIAIPFIFKPWLVDGRLIVDGFLSDPLPVGVAIREGASVILAMGFDSPYQSAIRSPARFAFQISSIMTNNLLKSNFAFHNLAHHSEVIPILPKFESRIRLFDTEKIPEIIAAGESAAVEHLPYLHQSLAGGAERPTSGHRG